MINNSNDIVASLRNNLKQIINLYEKQKEENKKINQINSELNHKISLLTKENKHDEGFYRRCRIES